MTIEVPNRPLAELLAAEARRPFALDVEPPLRAVVFPTGDRVVHFRDDIYGMDGVDALQLSSVL